MFKGPGFLTYLKSLFFTNTSVIQILSSVFGYENMVIIWELMAIAKSNSIVMLGFIWNLFEIPF